MRAVIARLDLEMQHADAELLRLADGEGQQRASGSPPATVARAPAPAWLSACPSSA